MKKFLFLCASFITFNLAIADQDITIVGGKNVSAPPIAIMNFANDSGARNNIANIINNDLNITGDIKAITVDNKNQIESRVNYIVTGALNGSSITYTLKLNNESGSIVLTNKVTNFNNNIRLAAHTISNQIYQKLTNTPGIFTSKIAYTVKSKGRYKIIISDYDGFNPKEIISTNSVLSSIAWNPNGSQIAYVSYEAGKPIVYVQDIYKPKRYIVSGFLGSNSSPVFTKDGNHLVVTLSKEDYGSQLYLINNAPFSSKSSARPILGGFSSINTEADLDKNNAMVFTSDKNGGPQIFMSSIMGSTPKRLTFGLGNYNTTARFSHDSSKITFIHRDNGTLRTYVQSLGTGSKYPVSNTTSDLAPSFAPNDKLILFSSNSDMYIANVTGTIQTQLNNIRFDQIIDQRWSDNFK